MMISILDKENLEKLKKDDYEAYTFYLKMQKTVSNKSIFLKLFSKLFDKNKPTFTDKRVRSVVACTLIGGVLEEIKHYETTKNIDFMKKKIKKYLKNSAEINLREYYRAIEKGDIVWELAIDKFRATKLTVFSFIEALTTLFEDEFKEIGVKPVLIEKILVLDDNLDFEIEKNTKDLVKYFEDTLKDKFDFKFDKIDNSSKLKSLKSKIVNEAILEGRI